MSKKFKNKPFQKKSILLVRNVIAPQIIWYQEWSTVLQGKKLFFEKGNYICSTSVFEGKNQYAEKYVNKKYPFFKAFFWMFLYPKWLQPNTFPKRVKLVGV